MGYFSQLYNKIQLIKLVFIIQNLMPHNVSMTNCVGTEKKTEIY